MENFKKQIEEDIKEIQKQYLAIDSKLSSEDYAFNFWILQKLYNLEEESIPDYILEDHDRGIDCYIWNEDTKELFLIQNKYYSNYSKIEYPTIVDQFLTRSLEHLYQGTYTRSKELQNIFNQHKEDIEFKVLLHFYITTANQHDQEIKQRFKDFKYPKIQGVINAEFYNLNDIENLYYYGRLKSKKNLEISLYTIKKQTRIDISPDLITDLQLIEAQVMPVSVNQIYEIMKKADDEEYNLFEENVREYIGEKTSINAEIIKTLENPQERVNFLYYNNGITIIADEMETKSYEAKKEDGSSHRTRTNETIIKNPQIVNGCQTVNSIYQALRNFNGTAYQRKQAFKHVYVMVKILKLSSKTDKDTYLKIVHYNNSQNAIKLKDFVSSEEIFENLKQDIKEYGFFIINKQSDSNIFKNLSKAEKENMFFKAKTICNSIDLEIGYSDLKIDLTKFLQTILAYYEGGHSAYVKKPDILKKGSKTYDFLIEQITNLTRKEKISIYLNFLKAEKERKQSDSKNTPVPYYLLTFLRKIHGENVILFEDENNFLRTYKKAKKISNIYVKLVKKRYEDQYNKMIKQKMHEDCIEEAFEVSEEDD